MTETKEWTVEEVQEILKTPKIIVTPIDKGNGHFYQGRQGKKLLGEFKSVTGGLEIIGGGKTYGLMWWAKRVALTEMLRLLAEEERVKGRTLRDFAPEMVQPLLDKEPIPIPWLDLCFNLAIKKDREKLKEAANIGTRVHNLIDAHITNTMPERIDDDILPAWNNFMHFMFKYDIKFVCGDLPIFSRKHKFGGRLDALAIIKKELVLLDWKTANDIRDDVAPQMGGYNQALFETYGIKASRGITVRFDKKDAYAFEDRECNMKNSEKAFLCALALNNIFKKEMLWLNEDKNKKVPA